MHTIIQYANGCDCECAITTRQSASLGLLCGGELKLERREVSPENFDELCPWALALPAYELLDSNGSVLMRGGFKELMSRVGLMARVGLMTRAGESTSEFVATPPNKKS